MFFFSYFLFFFVFIFHIFSLYFNSYAIYWWFISRFMNINMSPHISLSNRSIYIIFVSLFTIVGFVEYTIYSVELGNHPTLHFRFNWTAVLFCEGGGDGGWMGVNRPYRYTVFIKTELEVFVTGKRLSESSENPSFESKLRSVNFETIVSSWCEERAGEGCRTIISYAY